MNLTSYYEKPAFAFGGPYPICTKEKTEPNEQRSLRYSRKLRVSRTAIDSPRQSSTRLQASLRPRSLRYD
jgi:hypothetical protein